MHTFIEVSRRIGADPAYIQGPAGNTSLKTGDRMAVKASGALLKELTETSGYVSCFFSPIREFLEDNACDTLLDPETTLNDLIKRNTVQASIQQPASIETGMHAMLPSRFVLHTHSVPINVATCMQGGRELLENILHIPFVYIPYVHPGFYLSRAIAKVVAERGTSLPSVLILENHGLIVHSNDPEQALHETRTLTKHMETYLQENGVKPFTVTPATLDPKQHLFPDSIVFANMDLPLLSAKKRQAYEETASAAAYILESITMLKGTPRFLPPAAITYIAGMAKEQHRRTLFQEKQ